MSTRFNINAVGYNIEERHDNIINRPTGSSDYLFLLFLSNAVVHILDKVVSVHPGTCLLYAPGFPQWYTSDHCQFKNSYIHFDGIGVESFFTKLNIPLNKTFYPNDSTFINILIKNLESEIILKDSHWDEISNGILLQLFPQISRSYLSNKTYSTTPIKLEMFKKFQIARFEILQHPEYPWNLNEMAALTNLCVSRFSIYYKEFFGNSPNSDLIDARINKAKTLLTNKSYTVNEVAEKLGYNNVFHFIRQFKSATGCSPGKWN